MDSRTDRHLVRSFAKHDGVPHLRSIARRGGVLLVGSASVGVTALDITGQPVHE